MSDDKEKHLQQKNTFSFRCQLLRLRIKTTETDIMKPDREVVHGWRKNN